MKTILFRGWLTATLFFLIVTVAAASEFRSEFQNAYDRVWIGPEYWANPMEDWHISNGRLECITPGGNRNVQLITRSIGKKAGTLEMSVTLGRLDKKKTEGSAGFRVAIHDDEINDYRRWMIYGSGINTGIDTDGTLFIFKKKSKQAVPQDQLRTGVKLTFTARPDADKKNYQLTLTASDPASGKILAKMTGKDAPADNFYGHVALVNNHFGKAQKREGEPQFWFQDWQVSGTKLEDHPERAFGPIFWSMYTLSKGTLKLNAMMPPISTKDNQKVELQIKKGDDWQTIQSANIDSNAYTAIFKVSNWDDKKDIPFRLQYKSPQKQGTLAGTWTGTIRKDPVDKKSIVVAGFTGNADYGFPNLELVKNVNVHNPDVLFFSGDQIYEYVGGYGIIRFPASRAILNYLRKWYLVGLAFGDLMRDRPSIAIPDDHDVYQGNIWGNGGNPITMARHEAGGYVEPPEMVNVVHRTQCGNLPDPYDATPIKQNISVYYTDLVYGRIGFAVIADRMFKSGPRDTVTTWGGRPDHLKDKSYDVSKLDKPGLKLLGDRQLKFLNDWAADWRGVDMKCVLSQTIFCNLANYHGPNREYLFADLDSGGWPQSGRNRALDAMRRGFALHYAGDQHLASIVHHGIEKQGDSVFSFCVPSIANFYPRRWIPDEEGVKPKNRPKNGLPNTGDYEDGFGNLIRVHAIGNPEEKYRKGSLKSLHDKASGYGIVRFNRDKGTITMECWRLLVDVSQPKKGDQFPGWPKTISVTDNYDRPAKGLLPTLKVKGMDNPVVQVINQDNKEIVYTLRVHGNEFQPKVFADGKYTVRVGEQGTPMMREFRDLEPSENNNAVLDVTFSKK